MSFTDHFTYFVSVTSGNKMATKILQYLSDKLFPRWEIKFSISFRKWMLLEYVSEYSTMLV